MTALEVYDLVTSGGAVVFSRAIEICRVLGGFCLIHGLAVNCYVEPAYTADADLVVHRQSLEQLRCKLIGAGFQVEEFPHSLNAVMPGSDLRIQFTTDSRYQDFPDRAAPYRVLGCEVLVASLEDVTQGKLWAWSDPARRLSKRKKDELDLLRLAEAYPHLLALYPAGLRNMIEQG